MQDPDIKLAGLPGDGFSLSAISPFLFFSHCLSFSLSFSVASLSVCLSVCLSRCLSVCLSVCPCNHYLSLSFSLSVSLSLSLSLSLFPIASCKGNFFPFSLANLFDLATLPPVVYNFALFFEDIHFFIHRQILPLVQLKTVALQPELAKVKFPSE